MSMNVLIWSFFFLFFFESLALIFHHVLQNTARCKLYLNPSNSTHESNTARINVRLRKPQSSERTAGVERKRDM